MGRGGWSRLAKPHAGWLSSSARCVSRRASHLGGNGIYSSRTHTRTHSGNHWQRHFHCRRRCHHRHRYQLASIIPGSWAQWDSRSTSHGAPDRCHAVALSSRRVKSSGLAAAKASIDVHTFIYFLQRCISIANKNNIHVILRHRYQFTAACSLL